MTKPINKPVNMRFPEKLLKRIDKFREDKGFTTRTQTVIFLIHHALDNLLEKKDKWGD